MNHYSARQRINSPHWDWTCNNDGKTWACGACADGQCQHLTQAEAQEHEWSRVRALIREATATPIDGRDHRLCDAHGLQCQTPAMAYYFVEGSHYALCDVHRNDPAWYQSVEISSSY